jgi:hypothetical protein
MIIIGILFGFATILGLVVGANFEERKLLPSAAHIDVAPTDAIQQTDSADLVATA